MARIPISFQGLRIFLSYPRGGHGHTWAEKVHLHLENLGADVWRDEKSIPEGDQDWYRRIETGVDQADLLTCILGDDSDHCIWQKREMLRAVERRKPVVPLRIARVGLPLYLQEKQPVELRPSDEDSLHALAEALQMAWLACDKSAAEPTTAEVETCSAPLTRQRQVELD